MCIFKSASINFHRISDYVDQFQRQGRYAFDHLDLEKSVSASPEAVGKALMRLAKKHRVKRLRKGFYVILPVEYSTVGMIPPDWFIDDLMRYLQLPYYIGLQSAAALHGAGHQQAQQFQIVWQSFFPTDRRGCRTTAADSLLECRRFCAML